MKATIDENGFMRVNAESPLEAYALRKWAEENLPGPWEVHEPSEAPPIQLIVSWAAGGYKDEH